MTSDKGSPFSSTRRFLLTHFFPLSCRILPRLISSERSLIHRTVCTLPFPCYSLKLFVFCQSFSPKFIEESCFFPFLKVLMYGTWTSKLFRKSFLKVTREICLSQDFFIFQSFFHQLRDISLLSPHLKQSSPYYNHVYLQTGISLMDYLIYIWFTVRRKQSQYVMT